MKIRILKCGLLALLATLLLSGCESVRGLKQSLSGEMGEITKRSDGRYDIAAAGGFSGNRAETYEKWERTAKAACGGGGYRVIRQEWQSAEYPGILGGIVECTKKK